MIRESEFRTIFYRGLYASVISGGVGVFLAVQGLGLWSLVIQVVVNQITMTLFVMLKVKWKPGTHFSYQAFKEIFSFGKNILLTEFLLYSVESIRTIVIGKKYSRADLAFYDRGQVYPATLMRAINDTIFSTLLPHLARHQNDKSKIISEYIKLTNISLFFIVPIYFGFASVANEFVMLVLTERWLPSVQYIQIFSFYQAIFPYQITGKVFVYAIGNSRKILSIEIVKSVASLILLLLTMSFGVPFIAISLIFVRLLSDILYSRTVETETGIKINIIRHTWKPFFAATIMYCTVAIVNNFNLVILHQLVLKIVIGIFAYLSVYYLIDRDLLKRLIKDWLKLIKSKK